MKKVLVFCEVRSKNELIPTVCPTILINRPVSEVVQYPISRQLRHSVSLMSGLAITIMFTSNIFKEDYNFLDWNFIYTSSFQPFIFSTFYVFNQWFSTNLFCTVYQLSLYRKIASTIACNQKYRKTITIIIIIATALFSDGKSDQRKRSTKNSKKT